MWNKLSITLLILSIDIQKVKWKKYLIIICYWHFTQRGDTALHIAIRARSKRITELLLRNPRHSRLLYRLNKAGESPYSMDTYHQRGILPQIYGHGELQIILFTPGCLNSEITFSDSGAYTYFCCSVCSAFCIFITFRKFKCHWRWEFIRLWNLQLCFGWHPEWALSYHTYNHGAVCQVGQWEVISAG